LMLFLGFVELGRSIRQMEEKFGCLHHVEGNC
jgi:hypothetical protein